MRVPVILMLLSFAAALKHGSLQVGPHLRACSIRGEDEQLKLIRRREPIRNLSDVMGKPASPCKSYKLQSGPSNQYPKEGRRRGRGDLQKFDYPIQGRAVNCKINQSPMSLEC